MHIQTYKAQVKKEYIYQTFVEWARLCKTCSVQSLLARSNPGIQYKLFSVIQVTILKQFLLEVIKNINTLAPDFGYNDVQLCRTTRIISKTEPFSLLQSSLCPVEAGLTADVGSKCQDMQGGALFVPSLCLVYVQFVPSFCLVCAQFLPKGRGDIINNNNKQVKHLHYGIFQRQKSNSL